MSKRRYLVSETGGLEAPCKIQLEESSTGSDLDGFWHGSAGSVALLNGNRNVAYLDQNDGKRALNLNWIDNDWNDNYRFLAVRKSLR